MTTYTTPRYPVHLIDFVSATNGRRVTIRPMLPQDFKLQLEFFRSLSARARHGRFMCSFNELPDAVAERLVKIDYGSHLAPLAEVFEGGSETMVGEARYVIDEHDSATCEFAIAVADNWQRCGIGRALLAQLEREAAASGIRRMLADTPHTIKRIMSSKPRSGVSVMSSGGLVIDSRQPADLLIARLADRSIASPLPETGD